MGRHLIEAIAGSTMLVRHVRLHLMRARREVRLLLWVGCPHGRHVTRLLRRIDGLAMLSRRHEHHGLRRLTGLRALVHHHRGSSAGTGISTVRLRRRRGMLWVGMGRARRVHLQLRRIRGHCLGHSHVRTTRGLLDHHWSSHGLRIHKLRCARIVPHVGRLRRPLVHVKLRHRLAECQLCMRSHGRWIGNMAMLETR